MPKRFHTIELDLSVAAPWIAVPTGGAELFSVHLSHIDASGSWTTGGGGAVVSIEQTNDVTVTPVAFSSAITINADSMVSEKACSTVGFVTARTSTAEAGAGVALLTFCFYTAPGA